MKSLSKQQVTRRNEIAKRCATAFAAVAQAVEEYRKSIVEAQEFCQEVVDDIAAYVDEKSDKWREGERGQAYESWQQDWENVEFSECEPPDTDPAEVLLALDEEPQT